MSTRRNIALLFPAILLVVMLVILLGGQWPGYSDLADNTAASADAEEFLVNDDFSTADQGFSDIAVDGIGNFWIVWQDSRNVDYSIYTQHFAWDGERLGPNTPVNDDTESAEQYDPHVGISAEGYTKFVWQDYRAAGYPTNPDIYAQNVNADGSADNGNARVNSDFGQAQQRKPNLDMSPFGASVVVWEDYRNNNWDIYAQWYDNTGAKAGGNVKVNDDLNNVQHRPFSAADGVGNMLICWYDNRNGGDDIFGQIYDSGRNEVGGNFLINDVTAASVQKFPAAAGLPGGGFIVVWNDYRNGPYPDDPDIYAQKITATGQKVGVNFRVNDDGSNIKQTEPQIGSAPTGGFVVCWRDERGDDADIYAQRYEPDGSAAGSNFMVNESDGNVLQSSPAVAISDAKMYFTWTDNRNFGLFDIYARIITYDNPTISPIPSFVLFEAEDRQPNPPPQQVTVTNAGAGVLEWAAVDDAGWLSCSPNFGTAPTTVTLDVDITGMAIGDYTATVTFKDQNDPEITGVLTVSLSIAYGAPIITVDPLALDFETGIIGPAPDPQELVITNTGGKTLNWQSAVSADWISLTPEFGIAPSTTLVYIDRNLLTIGTHECTISIFDSTAYNPQVDIAVTCELIDNAPAFALSDTAVYFLAFERQGNPPPQQILVSNSGSGALDFLIDTLFNDWLAPSPLTGLAPEYIDINANTDTLIPGFYYDTLWFIDTQASNSPYGLPITVEVDSVQPEIWLSESEFAFIAVRGGDNPMPEQFEIINTGGSELKWSITTGSSWLTVDPDSGTNQQTVNCIADIAGLTSGKYDDTIRVTYPAASNSPQTIPVNLKIDEPDTLFIPELNSEPGMTVSLPIELINHDSITDISIPLRYDRDNIHLDSAVYNGSRIAGWMFKSIITDTIAGTVKWFATSHAPTDDPLPPGAGPIGRLYFSIPPDIPYGTMIDIDTATLDLSPLSFAETGGIVFIPRVIPGRIWIDEQLGIFEDSHEQSIGPMALANYPNPFNSETVIFIQGAGNQTARLIIYDVLGRSIRDLSDRVEPLGNAAKAVWDGKDSRGRPLGSGLYFAVWRTAKNQITRKIVLLR